MNTTIRAKLDNHLLEELPRFFGGLPSMVRELLQNAHRAGATRVEFTVSSDYTQLTVTDNGCGCPDPQTLLAAGDSRWDGNIIEPAGLGFFSLVSPDDVSSVVVESCGWKIVLRPEHVLAGKDIQVDRGQVTTGLRVAVRFKVAAPDVEKYIKSVRGFYPMAVFLNGCEIPSNWKPEIEIDSPVGKLGIGKHSQVSRVFWEYQCIPHPSDFIQSLRQEARALGEFSQAVIDHWAVDWLINPDCGVRPKLPDRESLVPGPYLNHAARVIVRIVTDAVRAGCAKILRGFPDEGWERNEWNNRVLASIPKGAREAVLKELGWKCERFDDPSSFSAWTRDGDWDCSCDQIIAWSKAAKPVANRAAMVTANGFKTRGKFPFVVYVDGGGEAPRITGLKAKKRCYVALAKRITLHGESLPYLLLDDEGVAGDAHVVIAGDAHEAIDAIRKEPAIAGWVAMRVDETGSLYNEDGWMTPDDDGGDCLDLSAVEAALIRQVSESYGARRNRKIQQYYELCEQRDALREGWRIGCLRPPSRAVAPEVKRLVKAFKVAERALDKAIERCAVEAGLK